jgi:hypothetical protein
MAFKYEGRGDDGQCKNKRPKNGPFGVGLHIRNVACLCRPSLVGPKRYRLRMVITRTPIPEQPSPVGRAYHFCTSPRVTSGCRAQCGTPRVKTSCTDFVGLHISAPTAYVVTLYSSSLTTRSSQVGTMPHEPIRELGFVVEASYA